MVQNASDLIKEAESLYGQALTKENTKEIREKLEIGIAQALGHLANIIMCDYLNRWNYASGKNLVDAQKAVNTAKRYAGVDDVAIAHYAQGFIYRAEGKHNEAKAAFAEHVRLTQSARGQAQLAAEMLYNGEFDEALNEINIAINNGAGSPALGMFEWIKGRTLFFMDNYSAAIPCLRASVDKMPNLWYNWLYLVSAYALDNDTKTAGELLAEFRKQFTGCYETVAEVIAAEQTNPNKNPKVEGGRVAFHEGLHKAGMPIE